ncbi:MAG: TonB-dependent receptor, partial [Myxococcota bacterium]
MSTSEATGSQTFQEDDALALDAVDEFVGFETTVRTVVKRPRPATASTLTLEADDLATASMLTADDAIRLIPGVVLVQHGAEGKGYQFFVRGFDALHGADIETRIAGVPFNEWSNVHASGYLDLSIIPPEIVSSVEVTKGPFGIDQGLFATAASIHYGLGIAERNRGGRAWYTAGSSNRHRLLLSYAPTSLDDRSFVTAEVLSDDGFGEGRATRRAGATARTTLYSDRQSNLTLFVAGSTSRFQLPGIVRLDDVEAGRLDIRDSYESDRWRGESDRALASLEYSRRNEAVNSVARLYGMARRLTLVENFTGFLGDPVNGDAFQQSHDGFLVGFDAEQLREFNDRWALTFSVGGRGERVQQTEDALDANGEVMINTRAVEGIQTG